MLVASAVLPMPGRPATMIRSEGCRPPILASRSFRPVAMPGQLAVALVGARRHVDRGGERLREALEARAVAAGLGELVEPALGVLDLLARREIDRRVERDVDHVLADADQVAAHRQVVDGAAVVRGVDDGGRLGGEAGEILADVEPADVDVGGQEGLQRDRRRDLAGADQVGGELVDLLVQRLVEMPRLEKIRDAVERLVVDQDRAEQRLLGLDVVRRDAILRRGAGRRSLRAVESAGAMVSDRRRRIVSKSGTR